MQHNYVTNMNTDTKLQPLVNASQFDQELHEHEELILKLQDEIKYFKDRLALDTSAISLSMHYSSRWPVESSTDKDHTILPKQK